MALLPSRITVDYNRAPKYPKENITDVNVEVTDGFICSWSDRITLAKQLLGFRRGSNLYLPHQYDFGEDPIDNVYCKAVRTSPLGRDDLTGKPKKSFIEASYNNIKYDAPEGDSTTYVSESLEPASEFLTLNPEKLYWSDGTSLDINEAPTRIVRMVDWVYTLHFMPYVPFWVWTHPGTVNNTAVYSKGLNVTFAAGTLLCGNPSLSRSITNEGATAWTITVRFTYRAVGWNRYPRPDKTTNNEINFEYIYSDKNGAKIVCPYPYSNFGSVIV